MTFFAPYGPTAEVDPRATSDWYAQAEDWGCACGHCRNFLALARARRLPGELLTILDGLSIPPAKATYVCELYTDREKGPLYQFSWRIAGRLPEEVEGENSVQFPWGMLSLGHEIYPHGAPGFPEPHFDLECSMFLPWVLDEPLDGPEEGPL